MKSSDAFRAEFLSICKVAGGKKSNKVTPTDVMSLSASGYQVERYYDLLSEQEFQEHYKMSTKAAGIKTQVLQDERGELRPFVLLQPSLPGPGTAARLRVFSDLRLSVEKTVLAAQNTIREGQAESVKEVWQKDMSKVGQLPGVAMPGGGEAKTMREIAEVVKKKKEEHELAAAQAQASASVAAPAPEQLPSERVKDEPSVSDDDDDEDEGLELMMAALPSQLQQQSKANLGTKHVT